MDQGGDKERSWGRGLLVCVVAYCVSCEALNMDVCCVFGCMIVYVCVCACICVWAYVRTYVCVCMYLCNTCVYVLM